MSSMAIFHILSVVLIVYPKQRLLTWHIHNLTRSLANLLFTSVTKPFSQLFVQYPGGGTKLVLMQ